MKHISHRSWKSFNLFRCIWCTTQSWCAWNRIKKSVHEMRGWLNETVDDYGDYYTSATALVYDALFYDMSLAPRNYWYQSKSGNKYFLRYKCDEIQMYENMLTNDEYVSRKSLHFIVFLHLRFVLIYTFDWIFIKSSHHLVQKFHLREHGVNVFFAQFRHYSRCFSSFFILSFVSSHPLLFCARTHKSPDNDFTLWKFHATKFNCLFQQVLFLIVCFWSILFSLCLFFVVIHRQLCFLTSNVTHHSEIRDILSPNLTLGETKKMTFSGKHHTALWHEREW